MRGGAAACGAGGATGCGVGVLPEDVSGFVVVVVEVSHGYRFLCHLEEFDFGCVVVVVVVQSFVLAL